MVINFQNVLNYSYGRNYDVSDSSFSPVYSTIGLGLKSCTDGIGDFWFNYNRACRSIWTDFLKFGADFSPETSTIIKASFTGNDISGLLSFFDTDSFTFKATGNCRVTLFNTPSQHLESFWCDRIIDNCFMFKGFSRNDIDARDPDSNVPFSISVKIMNGKATESNGHLSIESADNSILFNLAFAALEFDSDELKLKSESCHGIAQAEKSSLCWLRECLGNCNFYSETDSESTAVSKAVLGLIQNLTKAQGNLKGHISSFPSRGTYPTHFLWDSCFQNLAYELMNPGIAKDAVLCLLDNIRSDGKIGQFICSTWIRPHFSQPALVGWAALRYVKASGDLDFAKKVLPGLEMNNRWWLTSRVTPCGLVCCPDGLETGQDDSPRFDNGTTISVDMNSYLLNQMRSTSELFALTGNTEKAEFWGKKADSFSELIVEYLYNQERNMFYDITPDSHEVVDVLCCSNLLPLWAGVNLPEHDIRDMIETYLINPDHFFGKVPFPSVAYSDKTYKPAAWWRGPTWLPIAYLMLETLQKFGYNDEAFSAADRLYSIILADGDMREVYNSETGEGMCAYEQGWSCAVFLKLNKMRKFHHL